MPRPGGAATPPGRGIFFAGRLDRQKGALQLARALASVEADVVLTIAGDGPDRTEIESLAATDGRIRLLGLVTPEEVGREMERAAVVAVPSLWFEPAALVAAEAMAHGRPVLATRIGGLGDIVGDESGWLVEPDERGIAAGLAAVAAASDDEIARRGAAARARYDGRHRPDRATAQLIELYRDVIDHAGT